MDEVNEVFSITKKLVWRKDFIAVISNALVCEK